MASRIIHSALFCDLMKASTTLSRLTTFFRFWADVSDSIEARSSRSSVSRSRSRSSTRIASAPMPTLMRSAEYSSASFRYLSTVTRSFFLRFDGPGSRTTYSSK